MMAQNTPEDKEISDLDSWKSDLQDRLETLDRFGRDLHTDAQTVFLSMRGLLYEQALERARLIDATRSQVEGREEFVVRLVQEDCSKSATGLPPCGRIECWAAREKFVNIVVALIRRRGADETESLNVGLPALAIAAENNDLKMVEALKDVLTVADEWFKSSEPDLASHKDLFDSEDQPLYKLYPRHEVWLSPIEAASRLGLIEMVTKLIDFRLAKMESRQEKMMKEEASKMMKYRNSKLRRAFDWAVRMGRHEVVERLINSNIIVDLNEPSDVRGLLDNADVKSYGWYLTPLALAVLSAKLEIVNVLCKATKGGLRTDAKTGTRTTAIQIAFNKNREEPTWHTYKIWKCIMERAESQTEVKELTEERKVHVDAINAILVGTALIATATFAGWLSPPLGYSSGTDGLAFASVEGHPILEKFWVFNSLSFFFSIATFMVGANVALPPRDDIYVGEVVQTLRWKLRLAYCLVSAAVFFVIGAFACAGFAVLPPIPKYTVNMALTVGIGVTVVAVVVFITFFGHMFTKSGWQQLKHKMKFRPKQFIYKLVYKMQLYREGQQSKDEMKLFREWQQSNESDN